MKKDPAKAEAERSLQAELSQLVAQVKATVDKEERALVRIREILEELDAMRKASEGE
jgi:hypothetical protein